MGLSLYAPVESRPENRLVFSESDTDLAGMPRFTVEFGYSPADRALIDRALDQVRSLAGEFGTFDPDTELALLPPGSSLHQTGTVRAGSADDGTSVCDPDGRVWGFDNLYLAGNGVIPTAMAANVTLAGAVTAVRAARAVAELVTTPAELRGIRNRDRHPEGIPGRPAALDRRRTRRRTPPSSPDREDRMRLVHRLADRNWREGNGGPFAALVADADTGRIISVGVNVVLASGVSQRARRGRRARASPRRRPGRSDLGGEGMPASELVVNWRPCVQCYGATMWSGVRGARGRG